MIGLKETGIFEGSWFSHDLRMLSNDKYYQAGKLVAWSVLHGGSGPKSLAKEAYCILEDIPVESKVAIEKITDTKLREAITDLDSCSEDEFQSNISKHADTVAAHGYSNVYTCKYIQRDEMINSLLKQVFVF